MNDIPDQLIRLADVPQLSWLPGRRAGKRLHLATVHRWANSGLRGRVLKTVRCGGALCTTEPWLLEFFAISAPAPRGRTPLQRKRAAERAAAQLEKLGV